MRILIDIGHPAHVHYFKNLIKIMEEKGHKVLIIAKNRNVTYKLLDQYGFSYVKRSDYPKSLIGKLINIPVTDFFVTFHALKFKADILIGFSGTHISHAGFILRKPRIVIDDTEHAILAHASYKNFASAILTPDCFKKDFGIKHIRFKGYMELCYLHPKYYSPNNGIKKYLGFGEEEKFAILRFVAWRASHDAGYGGLSFENQKVLVDQLSNHCNILISSEKPLPSYFRKYAFNFHPSIMHDVLATCDLFVGEGATMASECAMLGTPAIYLNEISCNTLIEQEKNYGLVHNFKNFNGVVDKAVELITDNESKEVYRIRSKKLIKDNIDVTGFLVWFVENYPLSADLLKGEPEIQFNFRN
jgi:uncharacterized protein